MDDVRWFAPNRYCTLPVAALQSRGLRIATTGNAPARLALASDGQCAVAALVFARKHRARLATYLWDLPPWRLRNGKPDPVFSIGRRIIRVPRLAGGYAERAGYYSRIRYVARRADAVWCPSRQTQQDLDAHFGVTAEELPFCYDSDRFRWHPDAPDAAPDVPILLSISRLAPSKNHELLLRAAAMLPSPVIVRIIGRGEDGPRLQRVALEAGVALRLDQSWASDDEIVAAYREATVVVCPSRFEGFGLTPIEAVAMGRRVVASSIPTHREFLGDRVPLFDPDDPAALAAAISAALDAPEPAPPVDPPFPALTIEAAAGRLHPAIVRLLA
ncbi:MAG: glycosyltransferase [Gemmatimonadota bacterium]